MFHKIYIAQPWLFKLFSLSLTISPYDIQEAKYGLKKARSELEEYGRVVEEREGKIHTAIIDFSKYLEICCIYLYTSACSISQGLV